MKLIIDISEDDLTDEEIQNAVECAEDNFSGIVKLSGNFTNGDVIKAMFPNLEIEYTDTDEYTNKSRYVKLIVENTIITRMSADRWNAPYRKGGK